MKKILALAAVAALTAGVSAYAANPFSDVGMDHWAYQAVADLSAPVSYTHLTLPTICSV